MDKSANFQKGEDSIKVKCPGCNKITELQDLAGWAFIIMKKPNVIFVTKN